MQDKGQHKDTKAIRTGDSNAHFDNFVLEKSIFSNVFEKDIRRVYIYKKSERLAKAIHLIAPAFREAPALRDRIDAIAVGLIDAATLPPTRSREALSRELLALSSMLSMAKVGGLLSAMNAELIAREAHALLEEIAAYEEPRLFLDEAPTLAALFRSATQSDVLHDRPAAPAPASAQRSSVKDTKGHVSDKPSERASSSRRDAILSVLKSKGPSYIKDISTVIRDVSEKTIQRELSALVEEGIVTRAGERRWTTYRLTPQAAR